ncbi:MAG TPA: sulfotransferase [Solimonas sp.]|nr:sulfotransferase [Solimonas sp.]
MNDSAPILPAGQHPWASGPVTEREMLVVGGGYRCGTTSMFSHLAAHPEVSPSLIKEPAFFFSLRLAEQPQVSYPPGHEVWAYLSMFRKRGARVLLEGTSNYLNDPGCAARIARGLPRAKVILLLREPVARLVSWFKFLHLQGQLADTVTFESWIGEQLADTRPLEQRPYAMQAIGHCHYAPYVEEYLRVLGRERVLLVWFDEFQRDPRAVLQRVCRFAGIAADFYEHHELPRHNESIRIRRPRAFAVYRRLHRGFFKLLRPWPRAQHELKVRLFGSVEPRLMPFFTGPARPVEVSPELRRQLRAHFRSDLAPLRDLTGTEVPWRAEYQA